MDQQQEREVARGLRRGRTEAWRLLYDAHAERVWRLVARLMTPGSVDVADVVQETFLAAARSAGKYDADRGSLGMWLGGIARNHVAIYYRKRRGADRPTDPLDEAPDPTTVIEDRGATPPEAMAGAELAMHVRATLSELPIDYEDLLTAKYVDGATVAQIATFQQSTLEAVRSKLARARRAFRHAFERSSPGRDDDRAGEQHES